MRTPAPRPVEVDCETAARRLREKLNALIAAPGTADEGKAARTKPTGRRTAKAPPMASQAASQARPAASHKPAALASRPAAALAKHGAADQDGGKGHPSAGNAGRPADQDRPRRRPAGRPAGGFEFMENKIRTSGARGETRPRGENAGVGKFGRVGNFLVWGKSGRRGGAGPAACWRVGKFGATVKVNGKVKRYFTAFDMGTTPPTLIRRDYSLDELRAKGAKLPEMYFDELGNIRGPDDEVIFMGPNGVLGLPVKHW